MVETFHEFKSTIPEIIEEARNGRMFVLVDDEDRENEGDIIIPAQMATPEVINFMATFGRGLICLAMPPAQIGRLDLPLMPQRHESRFGTAFTVSIEAATGVTTGISAPDRARSIAVAIDPSVQPGDIQTPGHVFPLLARENGTLERTGHTEAAVDIARLAGLNASGVICEIMNDDGDMARRDDLEVFAEKHQLKIGTIADLIHYRLVTEKTTQCINERQVNTQFGEFTLKTYLDNARNEKHFALVKGDVSGEEAALVRVHINRSARDLLALESDAGFNTWSFHKAMAAIAEEGRGVLVLLYYPESAEDIDENIEMILSPSSSRTQPASEVVYQQVGTGSQILMDLGVHKMRLMSAPFKFTGISGFDLEVVEYVDCK